MAALKVKKGDRVRILQGKDRGKEGEVSRVLPAEGKVIVDGDVALDSWDELRAFYDGNVATERGASEGGLAVYFLGGLDVKWSPTQRANLTYCVSNTFGARKAAVSDSIVTGFDPPSATPSTATNAGGPIAVGGLGPWTCTGEACGPELNRIVYGTRSILVTSCQTLGATGVTPAMCHLNPLIRKRNIVVTYEMSRLGYLGRPGGAVVTIRMGLVQTGPVRLFFDLPFLGALIGLGQVTVPAMPVTVTSEDLNSGA